MGLVRRSKEVRVGGGDRCGAIGMGLENNSSREKRVDRKEMRAATDYSDLAEMHNMF